MDLSITRADHGARTVVHLGGEIDVYTAPLVREKLDEQLNAVAPTSSSTSRTSPSSTRPGSECSWVASN